MTEFVFGGGIEHALTHFAAFGAASLLEDWGIRDVRLRWSDDSSPRMVLFAPGAASSELPELVLAHALAHADPGSWVQQRHDLAGSGKTVEIGLFSPRIAAPGSPHSWINLYSARRSALDQSVNQTWLDAMMLQSIGEPAYWQFGDKDARYDEGASRWEMKTRNRGEDFTRNRLALLAASVSNRAADEIARGLNGEALNDSKAGPDSRTGTGLVPPGSVDDAVAWCALWGIASFALYPRVRGLAVTPAAGPHNRFHPTEMVLPVFTIPTSPAKVRRILRSQDLAEAAFGEEGANQSGDLRRQAAYDRLTTQGVRALVRFPIKKAGSSSAPERQVLAGRVVPLLGRGR
ncbi:hypothetical protein [Gordonia hydrophobica]|uniref:CRISPR-associated protein Csb3 n=1 Tax=Gordonia hydrophobica TaxID=40516 RepID=A0ABZ2U1H2_9ACTN|nr:hypothetical protein [Gordonia hydrophobica]MBM7368532.1 CRISPR-associated protein Csb3 [Gordonia hydrophobica]